MELDPGSGPHAPATASRHGRVGPGGLARRRAGERPRRDPRRERPCRGSPGAGERREGVAMSRGRPAKRRARAAGTSTPPIVPPTRGISWRGPLRIALVAAVMLAGGFAWRAWLGRPVAPPGDAAAEAGRLEP